MHGCKRTEEREGGGRKR
jgi:hypothetical protein